MNLTKKRGRLLLRIAEAKGFDKLTALQRTNIARSGKTEDIRAAAKYYETLRAQLAMRKAVSKKQVAACQRNKPG